MEDERKLNPGDKVLILDGSRDDYEGGWKWFHEHFVGKTATVIEYVDEPDGKHPHLVELDCAILVFFDDRNLKKIEQPKGE
ncbi:MAG: hypothetical protein J5958_06690 [Clostridia bacterium]|nr:hypothetical protein [Clostridia bacterium]